MRNDARSARRRPVAAASTILAALLAISLLPWQALSPVRAIADERQGNLVENSWRYSDGELIDDAAIATDDGIAALADDEGDEPEIVDNPWTWQGDGYINPYGEIIPYAKLKGIDVSEHQGLIDWDAVANSDIDFAIIRCGYGSDYYDQDDAYWVYNVTQCAKHGIPFGVYLYSYATNLEMAQSEVDHVLRLLDEVGYTPTYPIYLDLEDYSVLTAGVTAKDLGDIAELFCTTLEDEGYMAGVYANLNWWNNYLTDSRFARWEKWVAQYNVTCDYRGSYTIWQCTSSGTVPGIEGRVDLNFDRVWRDRNYGAYYDVSPGDWVVTEGWFDYVTDEGIMRGDSDEYGRPTGYFHPEKALTRAELATILYRHANPNATDTDYGFASNATPFVDNASGNYYTAAINWAYREGIMTGSTNESGNLAVWPDIAISRQELATMLARYAETCGVSIDGSMSTIGRMPDIADVADWALPAMAWCYDNGIIKGWPVDGVRHLLPAASATRNEAAKMVTVLLRDIL